MNVIFIVISLNLTPLFTTVLQILKIFLLYITLKDIKCKIHVLSFITTFIVALF